MIEDGETFTRFNETCEQEVFIFEDGRITHDVVYDSEIYSLVSVSVKNFGETVELNLESMSTQEPAMLSIFESKGMKVLTPEWSYEDYFVFEEDAIDLPEDPEECAMEGEDM